jgi:hypothetical protein
MNKCFVVLLLLVATFAFSQKVKTARTEKPFVTSTSQNTTSIDTSTTSRNRNKAKIDQYGVISIENDTTYIDTTLTIRKEYIFNYLRKDNFGLLPFANEGQTYNTLQFGLADFSPYPEFGFEAKHFNYLKANDIKYYSVATPLTELYFKTVMEQGQTLDSFITVSPSERLNFSIAYKGLRSLGNFVNQLSSSGNFRFTTNYNTKNKRYFLKAHLTIQDQFNAENGGIVSANDFEGKSQDFVDRARLQVYFENASSMLEGTRYFLNHNFKLFQLNSKNKFLLSHEMNLENKRFNFSQTTPVTTVVQLPVDLVFNRFGESFVSSNINNTTQYNKIYNRVGLAFDNNTLGQFQFFIDDFNYNYSYNSVLIQNNKAIPSALNDRINSIGGQYKYQKNNWNGNFQYSNSISNQSLSNLDLKVDYSFSDENQVSFQVQKINKLPNHIYNLYQSSYVNYNWSNNFKNEKITNFQAFATTKWVTASFQYTTINDKLYFADSNLTENLLFTAPKQYDKTINYLSVKLEKEIVVGKFALDNTVLFQQVEQSELIVNVPKIVTRNTIYYSDWVFKRAMFIQTGFILNYFSSYYANDYNPLIGEFYVQNDKKIGAFPMLDFFINAKVKQTRFYLKAEHFNAGFAKTNAFYTAPNYPYRDFTIRFGLVWNFFQ